MTEQQDPQGEPTPGGSPPIAGRTEDGRVYVVTPQAMAVESAPAEDHDDQPPRPTSVTDMVEQPAKVMRIGNMIRQLLDEVKSAPLDEASRQRLRDIHSASVAELKDGLAPELVAELDRLALPFAGDQAPTEAELRIAQAQLVGWLEGLFHGIQTALFAQQMAARAQLEQMRRALPGPGLMPDQPTQPGQPPTGERRDNGGMYL